MIYRLLRRIQDQDALGDQVRNMLNEVNSLSRKAVLGRKWWGIARTLVIDWLAVK